MGSPGEGSSSEIMEGISKEQRMLERGTAQGSQHASFPTESSPLCHPSFQATEADSAAEIFKGPNKMTAAWSSPHD